MLLEMFENFVNNFLMFSDVARPDQNAIKLDSYFAFCDKIGKNGVHKCLEHGR